jgi:hypothetical protein
MIYIVTGVLGGGKSLIAVSRIKDYLSRDCRIVTNMDLFVEYITDKDDKRPLITRVPDYPSADDLKQVGVAYDGVNTGDFNDEKAGLMVLDEAATWLNARDYRDKGRGGFLKYVVHLRKLGWHMLLLVQNEEMLDKQARDALGEHVVYCQRTDRLKFPIIGEWSKALGKKEVKPPQVHIGNVKYKTSSGYHTVDTWYYQGRDLYKAYNTCQVFEMDSDIAGICTVLPAYYIYGRYTNDAEHKTRRLISSGVGVKAEKSRSAFLTGALLAGALSYMFLPADEVTASTKIESQAPQPPVNHPLTDVYISASVKSTSGFDYVFQTNERVIYPESLGYQIRYINDCKANLISDKESLYIFCQGGRPIEATAQGREVPAPSENGQTTLEQVLKPFSS